jgi:MFS family permease
MLGQVTFGTVMIYPSPASPQIRAIHSIPDLHWSFYASVCSLFAIFGSLLNRYLIAWNHNSRRRTVFCNAITGAVGWLLNCLVKYNIWYGIGARVILGLVIGCYSSLSPMYMIEVAPPGHRGFFGCMNQFGITFGIVVFQFLGAVVSYQILNFLGAAVCIAQATLIYLVNESPVVALKNNAEEEAVEIPSIFEWKNFKGLFIGAFGMFCQQFSGINAILTNLTDIMSGSGLDVDPNIQAGIATLAQLFSIFISSIIVDRIGRRACWTISCSIMGVFLPLFALNSKYNWLHWLPMVAIFMYRLGFGLGLAPIPWFICSEIFNDKLRPAASSIVGVSNWTFAFLTIFLWPVIRDGLTLFGSMFLFTGIIVVAIIFGLIYIPDSRTGKQEEAEQEAQKEEKEEEPEREVTSIDQGEEDKVAA